MPTQLEFGLHVGISQAAVCDLMARGIVPREGTLDEMRLAYCKRLRDEAAGRIKNPEEDAADAELLREKTRLTRNQADKTALEVMVLEGRLIPADMVEQELGGMVMAARAKLLALPGKAAALVMAAANELEAVDVLKRLIWEALNELVRRARPDVPLDIEESDLESVGSTARPDDQRVGKRKSATKPGGQRRTRPVQ